LERSQAILVNFAHQSAASRIPNPQPPESPAKPEPARKRHRGDSGFRLVPARNAPPLRLVERATGRASDRCSMRLIPNPYEVSTLANPSVIVNTVLPSHEYHNPAWTPRKPLRRTCNQIGTSALFPHTPVGRTMVLLKGANSMLKLFLMAWPFCFLFIDFVYWQEMKVVRFEQLRARILTALGDRDV